MSAILSDQESVKNYLKEKLVEGYVVPVVYEENKNQIIFKIKEPISIKKAKYSVELQKNDYIIINPSDFKYKFNDYRFKKEYSELIKSGKIIEAYALAKDVLEINDKEIKELIFNNKDFRNIKKDMSERELDEIEELIKTFIKKKEELEKEKEEEEKIETEIKIKEEKRIKIIKQEREKSYYIAMLAAILFSADYVEKEKIQNVKGELEATCEDPTKDHETKKEAVMTESYDKTEESKDIEIKEKTTTRTIMDDVNAAICDMPGEEYEERTRKYNE